MIHPNEFLLRWVLTGLFCYGLWLLEKRQRVDEKQAKIIQTCIQQMNFYINKNLLLHNRWFIFQKSKSMLLDMGVRTAEKWHAKRTTYRPNIVAKLFIQFKALSDEVTYFCKTWSGRVPQASRVVTQLYCNLLEKIYIAWPSCRKTTETFLDSF